VGLRQQGVERDQQVEIERGEIHRMNLAHIEHRLDGC
jgi:hypothetical protein